MLSTNLQIERDKSLETVSIQREERERKFRYLSQPLIIGGANGFRERWNNESAFENYKRFLVGEVSKG
ncbi:hypothetical protein A9Q96_14490 [Rhodobacterales bacterium 52_120_T64]|nr:hypothetical protein A9Q96_14490 [Rhodobacterales bacterium 52_120_T64]